VNEAPIELIVAAFQDEQGADQALKDLKAAKKEHLIGIQAAVALRKDEKGKIHTKDAGLTPGKGAAGGAVLGAVVGILTGGIGLALGAAGALAGSLVGKARRDSRYSVQRVEQIADALTPGSSAILAVIEHKWVAELEQELDEMGADVLTAAISADIAQQLAAGRDVSYSALATDDSLTTGRVAAGADEVQVSGTTFTDEAVEHVDAVANEAGIAARRIVETGEGIAAEGMVITEDVAAYGAALVTDEGAAAGLVAAVAEDDEDAEEASETEEEKGAGA
jgi:uncharacterized membrane protein